MSRVDALIKSWPSVFSRKKTYATRLAELTALARRIESEVETKQRLLTRVGQLLQENMDTSKVIDILNEEALARAAASREVKPTGVDGGAIEESGRRCSSCDPSFTCWNGGESCRKYRSNPATLAEAVHNYDEAIRGCANDPEKMSSFCTAQGDSLDSLYLNMISAARAILRENVRVQSVDEVIKEHLTDG